MPSVWRNDRRPGTALAAVDGLRVGIALTSGLALG